MKWYLLAPITFLISCGDNTSNKAAINDTTSVAESALAAAGQLSTQPADSLCFLSLNDAKRKDTLYIKLYVKGDDVTGTMAYQYYQKDRRTGTLIGKKKGKRISAMWTYMQEGTTDSLKVHFKLRDNELHQMAPGYDPNLDQDDLPHDRQYKQLYQQVDCR
jgi:hypothetical protein